MPPSLLDRLGSLFQGEAAAPAALAPAAETAPPRTPPLPLYGDALPVVIEAEALAVTGDIAATLSVLRQLCFDDFGRLLLSLPQSDYPNLSELLPAMAADEVQMSWTGSSGEPLLAQSLTFLRSLQTTYALHRGQDLTGKTILDFGCGYGQLLRPLYYFSDPDQIYGFDPWDRSIELCREAGVLGHLAVSDYLPESLPEEDIDFDVIYCFSVFTHLSPRAAQQALSALRARIKDDGLLAITIRPVEYWDHDSRVEGALKAQLVESHAAQGLAFHPHKREPIEGDITYGDTTMTLDFVRSSYPAWRIIGHDRTLADPLQTFVFLEPA